MGITYIRLRHGFVCLVAIIGWYSRKVLAWRLSDTRDAGSCVDCLGEAIKNYGPPKLFNTDQGPQFTSGSFTGVLLQQGVTMSMDGRGHALDNIFVERLWRTVKYEDVYLKGYETLPTLLPGLTDCFLFYNGEGRHQSPGYAAPDVVCHTATGGGAKIVDKLNSARESIVPAEELGQHQPACGLKGFYLKLGKKLSGQWGLLYSALQEQRRGVPS